MQDATNLAEGAPTIVGRVTLVIGAALSIAPGPVGRLMSLDPRAARVIGLADVALVPGLLFARRRAPWMMARGALNLLIAAHYALVVRHRNPTAARGSAGAMVALTVADSAVAARLRRAEGATTG